MENGEIHDNNVLIKINSNNTCEIRGSHSSAADDMGLLCGEVRGDLPALQMPGTTHTVTQHRIPEHPNSRQS
jgi:hypothetical protein